MEKEYVNRGIILYLKNCESYVQDYRNYILSILRKVVPSYSTILFDSPVHVSNGDVIRIGINYEHTLVKPGGRDSENAQSGIITVIDDKTQKYTTRVVNDTYLSMCDIVIDYSNPNIFNVQSSRRFPVISQRHVYIAPCLYPIVWNSEGRTIDLLTTFLNPDLPRRRVFSSVCTNVSNCFDATEICALYQKSKVLINIHQTEHHHTVEELRILPALQNGVLVVCEESPLRDMIPYSHMIIWAPYESIVDMAKNVLKDYDAYWNKVFTERNRRILDSLHQENLNRLRKKLIEANTESKV